ncbi:MAG: YrdB family protein [Lacibacter sp.]
MSQHPLNLALRFLLELAAMGAYAAGSYRLAGNGWKMAAAILVPLLVAFLWGTFRVDGEPGKAPVPVPGWLRLMLEAILFAGAVWVLNRSGFRNAAFVFSFLLIVHYLLSWDRIIQLLSR